MLARKTRRQDRHFVHGALECGMDIAVLAGRNDMRVRAQNLLHRGALKFAAEDIDGVSAEQAATDPAQQIVPQILQANGRGELAGFPQTPTISPNARNPPAEGFCACRGKPA